MSRVFRTEQPAERRRKLMQQMGVTLRHAAEHSVAEDERKDMLAFLALCLSEISTSVNETCRAWERRDYWVKADRFRLDWGWAQAAHGVLEEQLRSGDIDGGVMTAGRLGSHLGDVNLPRRTSVGAPWSNAWDIWRQSQGMSNEILDQS